MYKKIHKGKEISLYEITPKKLTYEQNQEIKSFKEELEPLNLVTLIGRNTEPVDISFSTTWDCNNGIYLYGLSEYVIKAFQDIQTFTIAHVDEGIEIGGMIDDGFPEFFGLFQSIDQKYAVIVGAGYYEETLPTFLNLLKTFNNVIFKEIGSNYSNDKEFFLSLIENNQDSIYNNTPIDPITVEFFNYALKNKDAKQYFSEDDEFDTIKKFIKNYNSPKNINSI